MVLKEVELIRQITHDETLVYRQNDSIQKFYYKLSEALKKKGLYLVVINRIDGELYYTLGQLEELYIC